jgi:hypothetical protein
VAATLTLRTLTPETLLLWHERDERRRALEREARQLKQANDQVEDAIEAALLREGKEACRRHGFKLELVNGRAVVSWKEEYLKVAGPEAAAAAIAAAPTPKRLAITREDNADA